MNAKPKIKLKPATRDDYPHTRVMDEICLGLIACVMKSIVGSEAQGLRDPDPFIEHDQELIDELFGACVDLMEVRAVVADNDPKHVPFIRSLGQQSLIMQILLRKLGATTALWKDSVAELDAARTDLAETRKRIEFYERANAWVLHKGRAP